MKPITQYQANDGTIYATAEKAEQHDRVEATCAEILSILGDKPDLPGCGFENGGGYLQHSPEAVNKVRAAILNAAMEFTDHHWLKQSLRDPSAHPSYAGRIIDECCPRPIGLAWHRVYCIDSSFREWGQPFFASNPSQGQQVQLNA